MNDLSDMKLMIRILIENPNRQMKNNMLLQMILEQEIQTGLYFVGDTKAWHIIPELLEKLDQQWKDRRKNLQ